MQNVKVKNRTNKINYLKYINFIEEYDSWDKIERQGIFILGKTSRTLKSIGLKNRNIVIDKSKILKIQNDHPEMTDDIIKQIPNILEFPILVLKSLSNSNRNKNRIVIFGDVFDMKNNPVLVAMELKPIENNNTDVDKIYKVASAYGKENINIIQSWLSNEKNILYLEHNKKRTTNWLNGLGLQLPVPSNNGPFLENNISQSKDKVNYFIDEEFDSYNGEKMQKFNEVFILA